MTREEAIYELERMKTWSKELSDEEIEAIVIALKALSSSENPNTCGDAISRKAAIDLANELKDDLPDDDRLSDMVMSHNEGILDYQTKLSLLPSVTPQQRTGRWIPVSERLPEERKKCLVAFKGGYVGIMCYASDLYGVDEYDFCDEKGMAGWFDYDRELGHYSRDDVIAWMPLPEPYKAESEVDS